MKRAKWANRVRMGDKGKTDDKGEEDEAIGTS